MLDIQGILGNEKHLFSFMFMRYQAATATLCFLFENRQNKTPFLPGELWEEIKSLIYSESNSGKPPPPRRRQRLQCEPTHILRRGRSREKKGKQWRATIWRKQKHPELEREWLTKEFCPTSFSSPTSFWLRMLKGETSDSWKGLLYHLYHWSQLWLEEPISQKKYHSICLISLFSWWFWWM